MSIVFLGGFFLPEQTESIEAKSKLFVQYAANAFQRSIIAGLSTTLPGQLAAVNLPFIGSFPHAYSSLVFHGAGQSSYEGVPVFEPSFVNARFLRIPARAIGAVWGLLQAGRPKAIVVYSPYIPFMFAAALWSLVNPRAKVVLIVPDLIEFMGAGAGLWRKCVVRLEGWLFRLLSKKVDKYVFLTEAMAERLGVGKDRYIVVEGMIDSRGVIAPVERSPSQERSIVYAGTLDRRYGIVDLLEAFKSLRGENLRLIVCGTGDAEAAVRIASEVDPRIRFLGRLTQVEAQDVQRHAHILVNPRRPDGEFTKYSFPSKTLEYMSTGRPVVMHRLPGMPAEYSPLVLTPATPDGRGLAECLRRAVTMPDDVLSQLGLAARAFVLEHKTAERQCARIAKFIYAP